MICIPNLLLGTSSGLEALVSVGKSIKGSKISSRARYFGFKN
jgi:hypothetical protein